MEDAGLSDVAGEWPYHLSLHELQEMDSRSSEDLSKDQDAGSRARVRLTTFYHQLFPDLIDEDKPMPEDLLRSAFPQHPASFFHPPLVPKGCVANYIPTPSHEDAHRGWDSQPKVSVANSSKFLFLSLHFLLIGIAAVPS